jgi:hypothetical protein
MLKLSFIVLACAGLCAAQSKAAKPLTALDHIEIQRLLAKYAFALDTCANHANDYADLYTPDGVFVNGHNGERFEGRARLIVAAGGPGCETHPPLNPRYHTTENVVIEASPEGATGKSYLVYPGLRGEHSDPDHNGYVGGYQDVYVKTAKGWRFKSRIHVFPPQIPGDYRGPTNGKLQVEAKGHE